MALTKITQDIIESVDASIFDITGASDGDVVTIDGGGVPVWNAQVAAVGMQMESQINTTGISTATYNFTGFPFVVGLAYIEYINANSANNNTGHAVLGGWVNLRSFTGTKTATVSGRFSQMLYANESGGALANTIVFRVSRATNGTSVQVERPYFQTLVTGAYPTTFGSVTVQNWKTTFSLRVTAFEDLLP